MGRIWIGCACGAMLSGTNWILDFWSLGARGSPGFVLRGLLEMSRLLFLLPLMFFVVGLLVFAGLGLWRGQFRRMASSIAAIAAIPACFVLVARISLFDPWLWYALVNSNRFEALAANGPAPQYALIEIRDVSVGFAGLNPNHFVALVYDESDAVGLAPSDRPSIWKNRGMGPAFASIPIPRGTRLYGHFFRVDNFE